MCFFSPVDSGSNNHHIFYMNHWELNASEAKRDLILKKVATCFLAAINFAILGTTLYFIVSYCPVPTQALLVSPFIVGALAALAYLKFPTLGLSSSNYSNYLNPASLIGRGLAYLFFGSLMYAIDWVDWTPYHDPCRANKISTDLEEWSFEQIAEQYGKNFNNLIKYGFLPEADKLKVFDIYHAYKPLKKELDFWKKENLPDCPEAKAVQGKLQNLNKRWEEFKIGLAYPFPHPQKPTHDFTKLSTHLKLKIRSIFCLSPPIDAIRGIKI